MLPINSPDTTFAIREIKAPDTFAEIVPMRANAEIPGAWVERWTAQSQCSTIVVALKSTYAVLKSGERIIFNGILPCGTSLFIKREASISLTMSAPFHFVAITFHDTKGLEPQLAPPQGQSYVLIFRDRLIEQLARTLMPGGEDAEGVYSLAAARIIFCRLERFSRSRFEAKALPKWRLKKVQDFIEERLDRPIFLRDLASVAGLSRMHFAAQFRASTGVRPHDYVLQRRIERAKKLMLETDAQLVEIALEVGFQAQSHFSTTYKRLTGETPGAWRRRQLHEPIQVARSPTASRGDRVCEMTTSFSSPDERRDEYDLGTSLLLRSERERPSRKQGADSPQRQPM
jgi:AraC family transcriptional regulator